jgi:hypothetical protein
MAPGIMEDIQSAFDPAPIMRSVFGTGFPSCKMVEMPVGDQDGNISKVDSKGNTVYYVENPDKVVRRNGRSYQSRWTLDHDLTQDEWKKVPKTFCPDGSRKKGSCPESFSNPEPKPETPKWKQAVLVGLAVAGIVVLLSIRKRG